MAKTFNIFAVIQAGRLQYEAIVLAASLRHTNPNFKGRLIFAEPRHNHRWDKNPSVRDQAVRDLLEMFGAEIIPFDNEVFGGGYPQGNKIEGLQVMPEDVSVSPYPSQIGQPVIFNQRSATAFVTAMPPPFEMRNWEKSNFANSGWAASPLNRVLTAGNV